MFIYVYKPEAVE